MTLETDMSRVYGHGLVIRRGIVASLLLISVGWAQQITGVTVWPPAVTGGRPFQIRVTKGPTGSPVPVAFYSHKLWAAPFTGVEASIPAASTEYVYTPATGPVEVDTVVPISVVETNLPDAIHTTSVTVLAPRVTNIAFAPAVPIAETPGRATLTTDGPAPGFGMAFFLLGDEADVLGLPDYVLIPPGETTFSIDFLPRSTSPTEVQVELRVLSVNQSLKVAVTVRPPGLKSLALRPFGQASAVGAVSVIGGTSIEATAMLDAPAPEGGLELMVEVADPGAASAPASILVPAGKDTAVFHIDTNPVEASIETSLVVSSPYASQQAQIQVNPAELSSFSFSPGEVIGGQLATGFLELNGPDLANVQVGLSASVPDLVEVPPTVAIEAGSSTGSFVATTSRVTQTTSILVTASAGGVVIPVTLMLQPSVLGDADGDTDVDSFDYAQFHSCFRGPVLSATSRCRSLFGFRAGPTIDLADYAGFQNAFTGFGPVATPAKVTVDPTVVPFAAQLGPLSGHAGARPLAAMTDHSGLPAEFIENEVLLVTSSSAQTSAFLSRWQGTVLRSVALPLPAAPGSTANLIRIDTQLADVSHLEANLRMADPEARGILRVSSEGARELLAAAAAEKAAGLDVALNFVLRPHGFLDRTTTEAPTGPAGWDPNAFCWNYLAADSVQGIGVTEAWRALDSAGRLGNTVDIAIVDQGFQTSESSPNPDFPETRILPDSSIDPRQFTNNISCGGSPCPYHGTNVMSAAMAVPDNNIGVAGPAGPIATAKIFVPDSGYSDFQDFATAIIAIVRETVTADTRIFNMSGAVRIPDVSDALSDTFSGVFNILTDNGVLFFASAGNEGADVNARTCIPIVTPTCDPFFTDCCFYCEKCFDYTWIPCELDNVICVGGLAADSTSRASGSNYGSDGGVDVFAPFTVWVGPDPATNSVHVVNGTSFSSPYAAGVAALIWAADPSLSSGQVRDLLLNLARKSPDRQVRRYVDARASVVEALGNVPPDICILAPVNGCEASCPSGGTGPRGANSFSKGVPLYFVARVSDPEDVSLNVEWRSNLETGLIGSGRSFQTNTLRYGTHTITARVTDSGGLSAWDEIVIDIVNDPPRVEILEPLADSEYCTGEIIFLRATSFDVNEPGAALPDSNMIWSSDMQGFLGVTHETASVLNTAGRHSITVTGTDGQGSQASDSIRVNVLSHACNYLNLFIVEPPTDITVEADGPDADNRWYKDVVLTASAFDERDGILTGESVQWTTDRSDLQDEFLGWDTSISVRLYWAGCSDVTTTHRITVTATDSQGNARTRVRFIEVRRGC